MKKLNEEDLILSKVKRIHMIGIGGSGMCPLAEILYAKGYEISGSDNNDSDPFRRVSKFAKTSLGHNADNVVGSQLVVYSAAIFKDNVELLKAKELGIPTMERSHLLGALSRMFDNVIGVCGTHGKTTTTALLTQVLYENGLDPSCVIGGKLPLIDHYGLVGKSENFVIESCEYVDTFLQISEDIAILLNIDNDHLEYFKTMENLTKSFQKFVNNSKIAFINGDDIRCRSIIEEYEGQVFSFGFNENNDYVAKNEKLESFGYGFDVYFHQKFITHVSLNIVGKHNIYNGLAAFSCAHQLGIDGEKIAKSIKNFKGAARRFELIGDFGYMLADDYGHHPTEIAATLKAAKELDYKRIVCVFQPFTYSRTAMLKNDFVKVLDIADEVVLTPIMGSREINTYGIDSKDIQKELGDKCKLFETFDQIKDYINQTCLKGDLVITMGCGDVYKIAHKIKEESN